MIRAVFDENSLGFWLDILLLIETLVQATQEASIDLHGYSLVFGKNMPELPNALYRYLARENGGIFFDQAASKALRPYTAADEQGYWTVIARKYGLESLFRLKEVKIFIPTVRLDMSLQEANMKLSNPGQRPAVYIANRSFEGKRDKLYHRIAGFTSVNNDGSFLPLFVRFGYGGLNSLTDSWADWMHFAGKTDDEKKLSDCWEFLFRERLREKPSQFSVRTCRRYFALLLSMYDKLARDKGKTPVIILENIQIAEQSAASIIVESLRELPNHLLLGTCTGEIDDAGIDQWEPLFPQLSNVNHIEASQEKFPELPHDLVEIGYALSLLGRYFPPDMLPMLLEEMGKNAKTITRAFLLLNTLRVTDTELDCRPWHRDFQYKAEMMLGERKDTIKGLVRKRLLTWVTQKKLNPCFRLLEILKELSSNENIDDKLILQSILGELTGTDMEDFNNAHCYTIIKSIADPERGSILCYILETLSALHSVNVRSIQNAFSNPPPDCSLFPTLKAQVLVNQSLYYLGARNSEAAIEAVKESTLLCKKNDSPCLAQAYRLFALVNLSQQRMGETLDYLGFALEYAAKPDGSQEIGMSTFYAASVNLLYGNLSRSRLLAEKARKHFVKSGNPEWADRARFFEGRLAFEIGSYQQAYDIFEEIRQNPEGSRFPEKDSVLEAWVYRALCCRTSSGSKPLNSSPDADLFEVETLCLNKNYSKVKELSGSFSNHSIQDYFLCIERPDWHSGFAQCELLCFSWNDLKDRMLCAYQALAGIKESIHTMRSILRNGQSLGIDPYDTFYNFAWYRVLEQTGASQVDISTAVSVAFKRLQSRAARIDDMEIRRQYLTQPRWNKALGEAAKNFKLV